METIPWGRDGIAEGKKVEAQVSSSTQSVLAGRGSTRQGAELTVAGAGVGMRMRHSSRLLFSFLFLSRLSRQRLMTW